jgi:hypothetical protein
MGPEPQGPAQPNRETVEMGSEEEKGFKITDRRIFSEGKEEGDKEAAGEEKEPTREETPPEASPAEPETQKPSGEPEGDPEVPPIDFSAFVLSLSSSVLVHLGEVPDPITQEKVKDPTTAKQTIDVLAILEEKTRGNLTDSEKNLLENLLADLRLRYLKAIEYM